ncbi:MAG: TonB-dependent receptor [Bacteroidales bacterium]|nr:TonB-dependent receptor [Bacteroidales bacterium]
MNKQNLLIITFLFSLFQIYAQTQDPQKINEVVVSDTNEVDLTKIEIDQSKKLENSTTELIKELPGVSLVKRSAFSEEPMINAFKYDQVNVQINEGLKASSSCPNRMDPITTRIGPEAIKSIEMIKGPYDVRYGQIMGGLVRIINQDKPIYTKNTIHGNLGGAYNTNGNGITTGLNLDGGTPLFDYYISGTYKNFGNYQSGNGTEIASSYETYGTNIGAGLNIGKLQRISLNYSYSRANDVMHAGLPMDADYDISNTVSLSYSINRDQKLFNQLNIHLFGAHEDHLMSNANRPNASISVSYAPVESKNIGGKIESVFKISTPMKIYFGADFQKEYKEGNKDATIFKNVCTNPVTTYPTPMEKSFSVWQNSNLVQSGIFLQAKYFIGHQSSTELGLRSNFVQAQILTPDIDFSELYKNDLNSDLEQNFNFFGKYNLQLPHHYRASLSVGQGTRNASLLERYINHFTVGLDSYEYVGNPNLKAETNRQIDLEIQKTHQRFSIYFNVFYARIQDYISAIVDTSISKKFTPCKPPFNAKRFENIGEVEQIGFSFWAKIKIFKGLSSSFAANYTYANQIDNNTPLSETPPLISNINLEYQKDALRVILENEYQAEQTRVDASVGETHTPAFYLMNIKASYTFKKMITIGFNINNVLNENYYQHLSRPFKNMEINAPFFERGRNFEILINYKF